MDIRHLRRTPRRGVSVTDYALIAVVLIIACIPIVSAVGGMAGSPFGEATSALNGGEVAEAPPPTATPTATPTAAPTASPTPTPTPTPSPTPVPVAFSFSPVAPVAGGPVVFDGPADVGSWSWNFGDRASASTENPSHTYAVAGTYTVVLTTNTGTHSETLTVQSAYSAAVKALNPTGYWRLGETTGSVAVDEMGLTNGAYNGAPVLGASSLLVNDPANKSVTFGGTDQRAQFGLTSHFQYSTGTIVAWVRTSGAGSSNRPIMVKEGAYGLYLQDGNLMAHDWTCCSRYAGVNLADGQPHQVALTFQDGVPNGSVVYVDGVPILTTQITILCYCNPLIVGSTGAPSLNGSIDEPAIWNRVLSASEIAELYAAR